MATITATTLAQFLAYAEDAINWRGAPMVDGNVGFGKEGRGNLTQMKRAGLITTFRSDGENFIEFTPEGRALAAEHNIQV